MIPAQQPSQDDASIAEEEDALVLRMEAAMMLADAAPDDPCDEVEERLSFADSERFDDDDEEQFSAQSSESSSSFSHHWRGWAAAGAASTSGALATTSSRDGNVGTAGECQGLIASSSAAFFGPDLPVLASALETATEEGKEGPSIPSLKDLASRRVASALSFELIESTYARLPRAQKRLRPGIGTGEQQDYLPEQLVLMILRHCFPESVDNIRLYSCLTNCGDRLFALGEQLYQNGAVSELFQIGYHLSAIVQERFNNGGPTANNSDGPFRQFDVCIRVDRCRIVSCSCSCSNASFWCQHAVAACLQRIQRPNSVEYRPAIWDSITSLRDTELKKLAQYLVNELPKEYIPVAQKLIDALKDPRSEINRTQGAPDPTAGPTDDTPAVWCMDERALHGEVRKTLINFMRPSAMVCEVQSLLTSPPALAHEWSILHRTLCAKQPESMWNLLGMVRVMLSRGDANGPALLHVLTEECLALDSVLLRWYQISLTTSGFWHPIGPNSGGSGNGNGGGQQRGNAQQSQSRQLNLHLLCQELASLWQLVALNPRLGAEERERLWLLLQLYQRTAVARIWAILGKMASGIENQYMFATVVNSQGHRLGQQNAPFTQQFFPAFFPALQACRQIEWTSSEVQRIVQNMEMGSRLGIDIQMAERQNDIGRFPNLPFLREWPQGIFLMDLVEMEQKLGSTVAFNPDTVVLPPRSSKWKKKRRKRGIGHSSSSRKSTKGGGNEKEKGKKSGETMSGNGEITKRRDSQNETEQMSEVSTDDERQMDKNAAGPSGHSKKREVYEDALDALFAAAHIEIDDPFTLRFTCCDALFAHGYFREALQLAEQLSVDLLTNQPNLLARNSASNNSTHCSHSAGIGGNGPDKLATDALLDSSMSEETGCGEVGTGGSSSFDGGNNNNASIGSGTDLIGGTKTLAGKPLLSRNLTMHGQFRRQFSADSFRRLQTIDGGGTIGGSSRGWLCRSHPRLMTSSLLAKQTLWRTLFLAKLLLLGEEFMARRRSKSRQNSNTGSVSGPEPGQFRLRALELCLAMLGNPRGPAATKLLEMELNHLEGEINALLHRIQLCPLGLAIVREVAQRHLANWKVDGKASNNVTVPPTKMAHYIVNALSYTHQMLRNAPASSSNRPTTSQSIMQQSGGGMEVLPISQPDVFAHRVPADDDLALEFALQVLSKDVHISETDHPILCECIRRNRKDLQMILLTRNRDCTEKLARILGTVLDPKVHRMYEDHHCSNVDFFLPTPSSQASIMASSSAIQNVSQQKAAFYPNRPLPPISAAQSSSSATSSPSSSPFGPAGSRFGAGLNEFGGSSSRRTSGEQSGVDLISNNCSPGPNRIMGAMMERFPLYSSGPTLPMLANQASEAQAHHMFEFAKSLLQEAGGNQSSAMFNPMDGGGGQVAVGIGGGNAAGPHRNLHICSLLIALYALGLNNECSPSWNTRTYSTHVSWIQAQSLDIGRQALEIIRRTWRKHLTPTEVASLADKASQSADRATVEKAAQLALSVLPEANSLLPTESHKALNQCKERSAKMLEEACLAVEKAAEQGGVYPEVLFRVAHHWYDLYLAHVDMEGGNTSTSNAAANNANNHFHFHSTHHQHPKTQQQHSPPSNGNNHHRSAAQIHHHHNHGHHSHGWAGGNGIGANSSSGSSSSAVFPGMIGHTFGQPPPPLNTTSAYYQMAAAGPNAIINQHHQPSHVRFSLGQMPSAAPATAPPPPFFSPSIPPPPLPPIANVSPSNQAGNNSTNNYRLQPSFSAPNMASSQQQQVQMPSQFPPPQSAAILPHPPPPSFVRFPAGPPIHPTHQHLMAPMGQMPLPAVQFGPQPLANAFVQISPPNHRIHQSIFRGDHRKPLMDERALQLLKNVHRVGIAAMTNLRSMESVHAKFAKCPPNCDEICWLLDVSLEIADPEYVRLFCEKAIACVGSPFVLLELLRGVFKFFQHFPNAHRIPGTGQLDLILQNSTVSGELAKACIQQAKAAMIQHQMAGPQIELALHSIGAAFNAACHKLNFTNFNAPDQEYVCELAIVTRDLFRLIPPWHEPIKRKYMEWFMEHCGKQKCFKKFKSVQTAVQNALHQQQQQQNQQSQQRQQIIFLSSSQSSSNVMPPIILGTDNGQISAQSFEHPH